MNETTNKKEFAEHICQHIKNALPDELLKAEVCATSLDLWASVPRMALLIVRPWNGVTTSFYLDKWYKDGFDVQIIETVAVSIINDRRLYCMPHSDNLSLHNGAVIYGYPCQFLIV